MEIFSKIEQCTDPVKGQIVKSGFGIPMFFWDPPPRPAAYSAGPYPIEFMGVPFEYYIPVGTRKPYLVRTGEGSGILGGAVGMKMARQTIIAAAAQTFAVQALREVEAKERAEIDRMGSSFRSPPVTVQTPVLVWNEPEAPSFRTGEFLVAPETFIVPEGSARGVTFCYFVPAGTARLYVVRIDGADRYGAFDRETILNLAQDFIIRRRRNLVRDALIAAEDAKRAQEARADMEQLRSSDVLQLGAGEDISVKSWLLAVAADREKAIAEIYAGQNGRMRDWKVNVAHERCFRFLEASKRLVEAARKSHANGFNPDVEEARRRKERAETEARWAAQQAEAAAREAAAAEAERCRVDKLSRPIDLAASSAGIVMGTRVRTGEDIVLPVKTLHHMLVTGVQGSGKSVFLHQLVWQLERSNEIERLYLIDLKGGIELTRYARNPKVRVVYEFDEVVALIDELLVVMDQRQAIMRDRGQQNWQGGRIFVVIDEFAEIQSEIDSADGKEEKARAKRLSSSLTRISRRARALGIVLVCAVHKPTTDAMDSSLRTNLSLRCCFRVGSNSWASSVLDDLEELGEDVRSLPTGRYYLYDAARGTRRLVQTQIAPGVSLGDQT